MIVDPEVLHRARKGNRQAIVEVLSAQYPVCYRVAYSLTGREDVGNGVVTHVMKQSFYVVHTWEDEDAPARWFRHHTVLTARRAQKWQPEPSADTLLGHDHDQDGSYPAFIRALRGLSRQQVEAFLLTHCEKLDLRSVAVAMDCSTRAAQMHLEVADRRLKELAGDRFDQFLGNLQQAYEALAPSRDLVLDRVRTDLRRYWWPRKIRRAARMVILVAVLAAIAYVILRYRAQLISLITSMFSSPAEP